MGLLYNVAKFREGKNFNFSKEFCLTVRKTIFVVELI